MPLLISFVLKWHLMYSVLILVHLNPHKSNFRLHCSILVFTPSQVSSTKTISFTSNMHHEFTIYLLVNNYWNGHLLYDKLFKTRFIKKAHNNECLPFPYLTKCRLREAIILKPTLEVRLGAFLRITLQALVHQTFGQP